uniref:Uncharacterized protein n=1 Tax=Candidatus Kentrum sp. LFY TaxID=2126342 RepID=A0A450U5L1_9GAMM|nr:MAG: hypothetical protein BECKLFY1418B_GA0070995_100350 [Candidatus Kentron sp. LFY]
MTIRFFDRFVEDSLREGLNTMSHRKCVKFHKTLVLHYYDQITLPRLEHKLRRSRFPMC